MFEAQWITKENPRDRGACWAAVYGVAQSRTYVKEKVIKNKNLVLSAFRLETILCWSIRVLTRKSGFDKIKKQHWVSLSLQLKLSIFRVAPHSSTLAWEIPWMEEPGRLQSMGSLRVRHNWAISRSLFTYMHWRSKWQPTPVFLPGESQGQRSLVGFYLWGRAESDTTEAT